MIAHPMQSAVSRCLPVWSQKDLTDRALLAALAEIPYAKFLYALDRFGRQISANASRGGLIDKDFGRNRSQRPYLREVLPIQGFLLSEAYISLREKRPSLTAIHVVQRDGAIVGFLGADFDLRDLPLTQPMYTEPTHWRQIKGDPAIRRNLFAQTRAESQMDRSIDDILAVLEELICDRGVFHFKLHFSSSLATLWLIDDPYRFRILGIDDLMDPDICLAYPRQPYPADARIDAGDISRLLETFKALRFMDETLYLRAGMANVFNAMIGLTFSCDGSHYMSAAEFLARNVAFWAGTGEAVPPTVREPPVYELISPVGP
jgi:hypothetical protein